MRKIVKQIVLSAFALLVITSCSKDEEVIPPAKYAIDLSTKNYGNVEVEATVSQTFKISNKGGKDLVLESFTIKNTSEFSTNAVRTTVKSGKNYVFKVNFTPTSAGSKTATLDIATNVGKHKITLKGNATPKPKAIFSINPTSKDFGSVEVNKIAKQTFTIKNTGNADLTINRVYITGNNEFSFNGHIPTPITVAPNKTVGISIAFKPMSVGNKSASLNIKSNVGDQAVALNGKATAQPMAVFNINPTSKNFGDVEVNKTKTQTFTIKNTGNANLVISGISLEGTNANQFSTNGTAKTIAPNQTYSFTATFKPIIVSKLNAGIGSKTARIKIATNVGDKTVAISGNVPAPATAVFNINPTSKNFGDVEVNKTKTQTFTIKNIGNANLVISGISLQGTTANQFSTNGTAKTITPNQTYSFTATFKPTTVGGKSASLKIATNVVGIKTVTLSGIGTQPATACATPVNIPNANFKNALLAHGASAPVNGVNPITGTGIGKIDTNGDGIICTDEATAYTGTINVTSKNINNLTGIEAFTNITRLHCSSNQLTSLDITKNLNLELLICRANKLTSLDITKNTRLKHLICEFNQLANLDVTKNINLEQLNCGLNQLTSLDVTKNINLLQLYCNHNQLTNLDVTKNTSLKYFNCTANRLTSLDVTKNINLLQLYCNKNQLTNLDVTKNTSLNHLYCSVNRLTNLDVTKNTSLKGFNCAVNRLTSLDVTKNPRLVRFYCTNNHLTSLNVASGNNSGLRFMLANYNRNLTCIQHDSGFNPATNTQWKKDSTANWSTNCSGGSTNKN